MLDRPGRSFLPFAKVPSNIELLCHIFPPFSLPWMEQKKLVWAKWERQTDAWLSSPSIGNPAPKLFWQLSLLPFGAPPRPSLQSPNQRHKVSSSSSSSSSRAHRSSASCILLSQAPNFPLDHLLLLHRPSLIEPEKRFGRLASSRRKRGIICETRKKEGGNGSPRASSGQKGGSWKDGGKEFTSGVSHANSPPSRPRALIASGTGGGERRRGRD